MRKVLCLLIVIIISAVVFSAAGDKEAYRKDLEKKVKDGAGNEHTVKVGLIGFVPPQIMNWGKRKVRVG